MKKPLVRDCMDTDTHEVHADDDLYDVVRMLITKSVTGAPVVDADRKVLGMFTEAECLRLLSKGTGGEVPHGPVADFMSRHPVEVRPEMDIYYAAGLFNANPTLRRFAVVNEHEVLVAVVTRKDLLRLVHAQLMRSTSAPPPPA